jgi:hypothetical protein
MDKFYFLFFLICITNNTYSQIGIGNTNPQGALDVTSATNGLLIPRVALSATNVATVLTPTISEMVYNTSTTTGANLVTPGFYYWDGSLWQKLSIGSAAPVTSNNWTTTGNSGTNSTNYIGTSDAVDLRIATAGTEKMKILSNGQVAINYTPLVSTDLFSIKTKTTDVNGIHAFNSNAVSGSIRRSAITGENSGLGSCGVIGINTDGASGTGIGVLGISNALYEGGVEAFSSSPTGTGLICAGNGNISGSALSIGSGAAFQGTQVGSISYGNDTAVAGVGNYQTAGGLRAPTEGSGGSFNSNKYGVFSNVNLLASTTDFANFFGQNRDVNGIVLNDIRVGAKVGATYYKILGTGGASVSTTMPTRDGERILFAPEAPENWFFDINEVILIDGKATVTIDPLFVDCMSDSKPFKVFVQGAEDTLGNIRITRNQKDKTFLLEDLGGSSSGIVQYSIYAIWKTKENLRFPKYERNTKITEYKTIKLQSH